MIKFSLLSNNQIYVFNTVLDLHNSLFLLRDLKVPDKQKKMTLNQLTEKKNLQLQNIAAHYWSTLCRRKDQA